jgi:hypothetical protein
MRESSWKEGREKSEWRTCPRCGKSASEEKSESEENEDREEESKKIGYYKAVPRYRVS